MTIVEEIIEHLKSMPEGAQAEVLDFVEYLKIKKPRERTKRADYERSQFSLKSALKGIEEEPSPYRSEDLKETY